MRSDPAERMIERRPPRQDHEQSAAREPPQPVGEQAERRVVGPVHVIHEQHSRYGPGRGGVDRRPDTVEKARLGGRAVERRRRSGADLSEQARRLRERALRHRRRPILVLAQPPAQRVDHRAVGQRGLLLEGAAREHRRAPLARVRQQLLGQPRLPDARLALDHGHATVARDARPEIQQRRPLILAADERGGRQRAPRPHGRRARRLQRALADRLIELGRLGQRRHPQLARERAHAIAILGERGGAIALRGVDPDQCAVGRLVERVELEPAAGMGELPGRLGQPRQHCGQLASQRVGLATLPVLEGGRIAKPEALEEVAAKALGRGLQPSRRGVGAEAIDVDLEPGPAHERHVIARRLDRAGADGAAQRRERAPQRAARVLGVVPRPEQLGQDVARPWALDQRQVGEQRHRLAGVEGDRDPVVLDPRGPEQHHLDRRHLRTTVTIPGRRAGDPRPEWRADRLRPTAPAGRESGMTRGMQDDWRGRCWRSGPFDGGRAGPGVGLRGAP